MNKERNVRKGFKAFDKGLKCRGYQFEENEVFEEEKAEICKRGFHYCVNPFEVLEYYDLVNSEGNTMDFAEVEALEEPKTDDYKKYCTRKIKIGASVGIKGFVKACVNFLFEETKEIENKDSGDCAQLASSGDCAKLASSGNYAKLASSGYNAKLASSGDCAQLASSGDCAKLASSGNSAQLASSGNGVQLASSGNSAQLASSGYSAQLALEGEDSVGAAIGINNIIKGKKGCWITLAEYVYSEEKDVYICVCVKSAQIDGEILKEDVFYRLEKGEFVEVE